MAAPLDPRPAAPFRRYGLGYQYRPPEAPVLMTFINVAEHRGRGQVMAEVHVEGMNGGHILRRYLNLLGSTSVKALVDDLGRAQQGSSYPWAAILESATESVISSLRTGPILHTVSGELQRPPGIRWLCDDLLMAGVPNTWLAAGSTGKSTMAVAACVYHAVGAPFLGRRMSAGIPLYLDWESTPDDFEEKVWLMSRWLGLRSVPSIHRLEMRGPASGQVVAIGNRISQLDASLVVWDGVQAAGGPVGQFSSYESVAMELETMVGLLPRTTHLLLDHVTGDDLKQGIAPVKGRGAVRKVEWTRNQWSLIADQDARAQKRHVVGWTHTKINRGEFFPAFGVEIVHRPDEMGFQVLAESEVAPLQQRMPQWQQLLAVMQAADGPLTVHAATERWQGKSDRRATDLTRAIVNRYTRVFTKNTDGTFEPHWQTRQQAKGNADSADNGQKAPEQSHLRIVDSATEDVDDLPW